MPRLSTGLLAQAELLAKKEPRRPQEASIRRSISTAYYSLFHFLIEEATGLLLGAGPKDEEFRHLLARAAVHGTMKKACQEFIKPSLSTPFGTVFNGLNATGTEELKTVSKVFVNLQEKRHVADYNVSATLNKATALWCVSEAGDAFRAWRTVKAANRRKAVFFSVLLFQYDTLSKRK